MQARFYNMIRDDRHIFKVKESDQTNTEPVDIQMLSDKNNVTRPIIRVQTGRLGRSTNYVYLSEVLCLIDVINSVSSSHHFLNIVL